MLCLFIFFRFAHWHLPSCPKDSQDDLDLKPLDRFHQPLSGKPKEATLKGMPFKVEKKGSKVGKKGYPTFSKETLGCHDNGKPEGETWESIRPGPVKKGEAWELIAKGQKVRSDQKADSEDGKPKRGKPEGQIRWVVAMTESDAT